MSAQTLPAKQLIGKKVCNKAGEHIGTIHDLMVEFKSGKILYAAVSLGGWFGIGAHYYAIPIEAFSVDEESGITVNLNISPEKLKKMDGFDKNSWPTHSTTEECVTALRGYKGYRRVAAK